MRNLQSFSQIIDFISSGKAEEKHTLSLLPIHTRITSENGEALILSETCNCLGKKDCPQKIPLSSREGVYSTSSALLSPKGWLNDYGRSSCL